MVLTSVVRRLGWDGRRATVNDKIRSNKTQEECKTIDKYIQGLQSNCIHVHVMKEGVMK